MPIPPELSTLRDSIAAHLAKHPKPASYIPSYGTAGFRDEASKLPGIMYRCGILVAARAVATSADTGIVITASHNPERDNGVKLVEPDGSMLCADWEEYANSLAAADTPDAILSVLSAALQGHTQAVPAHAHTVLVGHDTRASSIPLTQAAADGASLLCKVLSCGLVTTPQLHWMVRQRNAGLPSSQQDYADTLLTAFATLTQNTPAPSEPLHLDCANGVGAAKLQAMAAALAHAGLHLELYNTGAGTLNHLCGSDFVQKDKALPQGFEAVGVGARCASVDGDADRLLYFARQADGLLLLDGDRIAALAAILVQKLLSQLPASAGSFTVGIVQTAYANGASTDYLKSLGVQIGCTPTGVKHLHHAAVAYDVGVYFEANGHGTVLFSQALLDACAALQGSVPAAAQLLALSRLINQAVGDAISGVLLVEVALRLLGDGDGMAWWGGLYQDLPSRQTKVVVPDRTRITTADAERRVVQPDGLQQRIDALVSAVPRGRSFVRPSGTEDIVRVYAEATTQQAADDLAAKVAEAVKATCG